MGPPAPSAHGFPPSTVSPAHRFPRCRTSGRRMKSIESPFLHQTPHLLEQVQDKLSPLNPNLAGHRDILNYHGWLCFVCLCLLNYSLKNTRGTKTHMVYSVPNLPAPPPPRPCQLENAPENSPEGWKPVRGQFQLERIVFRRDAGPIHNGNPDGPCGNYSFAVMNVPVWSVLDFSMEFFHGRVLPERWEPNLDCGSDGARGLSGHRGA